MTVKESVVRKSSRSGYSAGGTGRQRGESGYSSPANTLETNKTFEFDSVR